ncbi:hypothetical protein ACFX2B_018934 [Malus domestica]
MLSPCPFSSQHLLSSTHHRMLSLRLSRIREVKMIPRSMWRQRADSSSTKDKEKESKRWALGKIEERNRPTPFPRACPSCRRNKQRGIEPAQSTREQKVSELKNSRSFNNIAKEQSLAVQYHQIITCK